MPIETYHSDNFETLSTAFNRGEVCLLESIRKEDNQKVVLLCAVAYDGKNYNLTPFAEMVNCNPFEKYLPPINNKEQ